MKVLNALSRDDTEHGVYYYLASAVDAELAKKDAEIARLKAGWEHEATVKNGALTAERDAFAVDLANSQDYAKSEYLLREEAEAERDAYQQSADKLAMDCKVLREALELVTDYVHNNLSNDYPTGVDTNGKEFRQADQALEATK